MATSQATRPRAWGEGKLLLPPEPGQIEPVASTTTTPPIPANLPKRRSRAWWDAQKPNLRHMYYEKLLSCAEIARAYGVHRSHIRDVFRKRWGWQLRKGGLNTPAAVRRYWSSRGCPYGPDRLQKEQHRWWMAKRDEIWECLSNGVSVANIALRLGIGQPTLSKWLPRLGFHRRWIQEEPPLARRYRRA